MNFIRSGWIVIAVGLLWPATLSAQLGSGLTVTATTQLDIPLGPLEEISGNQLYDAGGGVSLQGAYRPPFAPFLNAGAVVNADFIPFGNRALSIVSLGAQLGAGFSPLPRFSLSARGYGGLYLGIVEEGVVRNPFLGGGLDFSYLLRPSLSVTAGASYSNYLLPDDSLYQGISINAGVVVSLGGRDRSYIEYDPIIDSVFPLFYSYYDTNPLGAITLLNNEATPINNVDVSLYVRKYMDQPKRSGTVPVLAGGEEVQVPIYALFTDEIFQVTEGDTVAGEILVAYTYLGKREEVSVPVSLDVKNRNAMTWDDDRKAAAFVTAKDPAILGFSKNIAGAIRSDSNTAVTTDFRIAMGLFQALELYGIGYVPDPSTPYADLSENPTAVDFVQFPTQTLSYRAGDCDDIAILYSALLEAAGIETAFITAPGHIYMAFNAGMEPDQARAVFERDDELIFIDDTTWVPVEITLVGEGFNKAWQIGAKEWRETSVAGTAGFYPVRESWGVYEPVGFSAEQISVVLPDTREVMRRFGDELDRFIQRQISDRVAELERRIRTSNNSYRQINRLGVLYARFGLLEEAEDQFRGVVARREFAPALVNLGHIAYLQEEYERAVSYYNRAISVSGENAAAMLGLAKAEYELENYSSVDVALTELQTLSPELASRFSYLGSTDGDENRASQALVKEVYGWDVADE